MYLKYKQWWHKWGQTYQTHRLSACKSLHCILRGMWRNLRIPTYTVHVSGSENMGNNLSDIHLYIIVIDVIICKRVHYKKNMSCM